MKLKIVNTVGGIILFACSAHVQALQVPAAEAGNCSFPGVAGSCPGWATTTYNRSDTLNPVQHNETTTKIDSLTTDNCSPGAAPRPMGNVGSSDSYSQTYNASIAPGISGGDDVKLSLNGALGFSSSSTLTCTATCTAPDVPACKTTYIEVRAHIDAARSVSMNHAYSATMVFQATIPPSGRAPDCQQYAGQTVNSTGCTGNTSSSVSGNTATDFYCPTPVTSQCTCPACNT